MYNTILTIELFLNFNCVFLIDNNQMKFDTGMQKSSLNRVSEIQIRQTFLYFIFEVYI